MAKPVCTEDIVPPRKRVTFVLSDYSIDPVVPLSSEPPCPQSSSTSASTSSPLPFGQSLSLLLSDPPPAPKTSNTVAVFSCPGSSFCILTRLLIQGQDIIVRFVSADVTDSSKTGLRFPLNDELQCADLPVASYEEVETSSADSSVKSTVLFGDLWSIPLKHPYTPSLTAESPLHGQPRLFFDEDYIVPPDLIYEALYSST